MICMPTGIPSTCPIGAQITGSPTQEMGCVRRPVFGRTSISLPLKSFFSSPIREAVQGVAGARITSTEPKSRITFW